MKQLQINTARCTGMLLVVVFAVLATVLWPPKVLATHRDKVMNRRGVFNQTHFQIFVLVII